MRTSLILLDGRAGASITLVITTVNASTRSQPRPEIVEKGHRRCTRGRIFAWPNVPLSGCPLPALARESEGIAGPSLRRAIPGSG